MCSWVEQLGVAIFDLLHGPTLIGSAGRPILFDGSPLLFHAFPEGHGALHAANAAASSGEDLIQVATYFFSLRDPAAPRTQLFGFVFHRQLHSTDLQRNSDRRSIVLLTRVPLHELWRQVLDALAVRLLSTPAVEGPELLTALEDVRRQIAAWGDCNLAGLAGRRVQFSLLGRQLRAHVPAAPQHVAPGLEARIQHLMAAVERTRSYKLLHAKFNARMEENARAREAQITAKPPGVALRIRSQGEASTSGNGSASGSLAGPARSSWQPSLGVPALPAAVRAPLHRDAARKPDAVYAAHGEHGAAANQLDLLLRQPVRKSGDNGSGRPRASVLPAGPPAPLSSESASAATAVDETAPRAPALASLFQSIDLYDALKGLAPHLWALWELVLTAQPILIVGRDPSQVSRTVAALPFLIQPLEYEHEICPIVLMQDVDMIRALEGAFGKPTRAGAAGSLPSTPMPSSRHLRPQAPWSDASPSPAQPATSVTAPASTSSAALAPAQLPSPSALPTAAAAAPPAFPREDAARPPPLHVSAPTAAEGEPIDAAGAALPPPAESAETPSHSPVRRKHVPRGPSQSHRQRRLESQEPSTTRSESLTTSADADADADGPSQPSRCLKDGAEESTAKEDPGRGTPRVVPRQRSFSTPSAPPPSALRPHVVVGPSSESESSNAPPPIPFALPPLSLAAPDASVPTLPRIIGVTNAMIVKLLPRFPNVFFIDETCGSSTPRHATPSGPTPSPAGVSDLAFVSTNAPWERGQAPRLAAEPCLRADPHFLEAVRLQGSRKKRSSASIPLRRHENGATEADELPRESDTVEPDDGGDELDASAMLRSHFTELTRSFLYAFRGFLDPGPPPQTVSEALFVAPSLPEFDPALFLSGLRLQCSGLPVALTRLVAARRAPDTPFQGAADPPSQHHRPGPGHNPAVGTATGVASQRLGLPLERLYAPFLADRHFARWFQESQAASRAAQLCMWEEGQCKMLSPADLSQGQRFVELRDAWAAVEKAASLGGTAHVERELLEVFEGMPPLLQNAVLLHTENCRALNAANRRRFQALGPLGMRRHVYEC